MALNYDSFRDAIATRESNDDYQCVNSLGYLGRYQFGMARLSDFGLTQRIPGMTGFANSKFEWLPPFTQSGFLNSTALQDAVFDCHVADLIKSINNSCGGLIGSEQHGTLLTLSGAVACCHLLGLGGLLDFIHGSVDADANGVTAPDYIEPFNGYDLSTLQAPDVSSLVTLLSAESATAAQALQARAGRLRCASLWRRFLTFLGWLGNLFGLL